MFSGCDTKVLRISEADHKRFCSWVKISAGRGVNNIRFFNLQYEQFKYTVSPWGTAYHTEVQTDRGGLGRSAVLIDNVAAAVLKIAQWRYRSNLVQWLILNKEPRSLFPSIEALIVLAIYAQMLLQVVSQKWGNHLQTIVHQSIFISCKF